MCKEQVKTYQLTQIIFGWHNALPLVACQRLDIY
jgi:hypothetical protein